jgi:transcriptional regulator with XRE-family HTH domain
MNEEPITDYLKRRLKDAGAARFDAIAEKTGVTASFIRKFAYGSRENPRVQTVQPLIDFFAAVDRGDESLPDPVKTAA